MIARAQRVPADACTLVIFGASGDLTTRLLAPALQHLRDDAMLAERFAIVGVSRSAPTAVVQELPGFHHVHGDFDDPALWERLSSELTATAAQVGTGNCLFYLATAPEQFSGICQRLAQRRLLDEGDGGWRRVVVEKPFGRDVASARALNQTLQQVMQEQQIYRIDHYLGKETVQNILVFRFGNGIFEPVWNRRYVDHVQITVAETLGVGSRSGYYERAGALRDMVPNHLFQLLTLTAMEPPSSLEPRALHQEQAKVLEAIDPLAASSACGDVVRAQYDAGIVGGEAAVAYRAEEKVDPASSTETYVALALSIDNWRWAGVPFYLRTGKRLTGKRTEVVIGFKQPPLALFRHAERSLGEPNQLVIEIQPEETITLQMSAKVPGPDLSAAAVSLRFDYDEHFGDKPQTGYETLLYDAMTGDRSLFKPAEVFEAGWQVVDPVLRAWEEGRCGLERYAAGTSGPAAADGLLQRAGHRWREL